MMLFLVTVLFATFTAAYGQETYSWDRINSHVKDLSVKGNNVIALNYHDQILQLVDNAWAEITYTANHIYQIAAGKDGSVYFVGKDHGIWRYNPATKAWALVPSSNDIASVNAQDVTHFVVVATQNGRVGKNFDNVWSSIGSHHDVAGYVNREIAIGTDSSIFKINEQGVLSKFDGTSFNTIALDPNMGEPVQIDVHSATRVVVVDHTQTPFLYNGATWINLGGGFNCLKATVSDTKVYCIDQHGCVRTVTA